MLISSSVFADDLPATARASKKWAVAVSGGADSLCLTFLANEYAEAHDISLFAILVDHRLRPNSGEEIDDVVKMLSSYPSINTRVLRWEHSDDIGGNIESKARDARYNLLINCCEDNGIGVLMTAHHALDQWETFLMRLSRGSALRGLSCIRPASERAGIQIVRPLLNFTPQDLKETLATRFGITDYKHDPMNDQTRFERVRWRRMYSEISEEYGLGIEHINRTVTRLQVADDCLNHVASKIVSEIYDGQYLLGKQFKELHLELRMRILNIILNRGKVISYDLIRRVAEQMCNPGFVATNLGGYIIRRIKTNKFRIEIDLLRNVPE
ncbi:MAG: tRNA lysidine(34) synthetase TilS [Holosporales bacterium]|nr:tRNA lysidine(34) synthetase TilS [Holosporales bacterium]